MALFYVGPRKVLKGRSSADMVHPYKKTSGTYSFYPLYSTSHVFDGAPNINYVPGSGNHPHDLRLSRDYIGYKNGLQPLKGAGSGTRIDGMRFGPYLNRSVTGSLEFNASFGHQIRTTDYSYNRRYEHIYKFQRLSGAGHVVRYTSTGGAADSFGAFGPNINKGTGKKVFASTFGQAVPAGYDNQYGHNRVNEWRGTTSSKALDV